MNDFTLANEIQQLTAALSIAERRMKMHSMTQHPFYLRRITKRRDELEQRLKQTKEMYELHTLLGGYQ